MKLIGRLIKANISSWLQAKGYQENKDFTFLWQVEIWHRPVNVWMLYSIQPAYLLAQANSGTPYVYIIELQEGDLASSIGIKTYLETGHDYHFTTYQEMLDLLASN